MDAVRWMTCMPEATRYDLDINAQRNLSGRQCKTLTATL